MCRNTPVRGLGLGAGGLKGRGWGLGAGGWRKAGGYKDWGLGLGTMSKVSHFRGLRVWQGAMDLVEAVYRLSEAFPKTEIYGLTAQVRRAAVSVPSNIAEGHTRASTKEYLNHLSIAQASLAEIETQLEIAQRLNY